MCGPLVAMLGFHRFRLWYFVGRTLAFGAAGFFAGFAGSLLQVVLSKYHIGALSTLFFGIVILSVSLKISIALPGIDRVLKPLSRELAQMLLRDQRATTFLFGLATILLPCGQTVVVFSACAIEGDAFTALFNGVAFALLTSPSLFVAMHTQSFLQPLKKYHSAIFTVFGSTVGILAILRAAAELQLIPHFILNPHVNTMYHIVLF